MLGAIATGETEIRGLLEGEDVVATGRALIALGADVSRSGDVWRVRGAGVGGLVAPEQVLDMGNSGTGARLLMGLLASHEFNSVITGDASLVKRPMGRVMAPLRLMGADFDARDGDRLPLTVRGAPLPVPIEYVLPVASAQVKSAVLLAGLNTAGRTTVVEPAPTRDHTERMLRHFGARIDVQDTAEGRRVTVDGYAELSGQQVQVPADPSSAAFPLVAALLTAGSAVTLTGVGLNPLRAGLFETLCEMGADLAFDNQQDVAGEPVADITATASALTGVTVPAVRAPSMIDEFPILAVAAACAIGDSRFEGVGELRVKESDRLAAVEAGLRLCGVETESGDDWLAIQGCGGPPPGPAPDAAVATHLDHRIAMSFVIMGLAAQKPVTIDDAAMIDTSYPGFVAQMSELGASLTD
jgi:3-phosphoshikimate 1-carboxyvinyltransferase